MIIVRPYKRADQKAFFDLNMEWIEPNFAVEAEDLAQLQDPDATILDRGGRILVAELEGTSVGTVALVPGHREATVELIKMSARRDLRRRGIGRALMNAAIETAQDMNARYIWLETNTKLAAAISLYRKVGFRELYGDDLHATPYDRCNCQMILSL